MLTQLKLFFVDTIAVTTPGKGMMKTHASVIQTVRTNHSIICKHGGVGVACLVSNNKKVPVSNF